MSDLDYVTAMAKLHISELAGARLLSCKRTSPTSMEVGFIHESRKQIQEVAIAPPEKGSEALVRKLALDLLEEALLCGVCGGKGEYEVTPGIKHSAVRVCETCEGSGMRTGPEILRTIDRMRKE